MGGTQTKGLVESKQEGKEVKMSQKEIVALIEKVKENINEKIKEKVKEGGVYTKCSNCKKEVEVIYDEDCICKECRKSIGLFKKWKKYYGDACVRIFREFISREISSEYTVSSPNAYIEGYPTEFDLLVVVDDNASPMEHTNAYFPEKVKCGFEIKAHGTGYGSHEDLEKDIKRIKDNFVAVNKKQHHINFVYLTYEETINPKRDTSIRYLDETKKVMEPYKVFCLRDSSRKRELQIGTEHGWEELVCYLNNSLQS